MASRHSPLAHGKWALLSTLVDGDANISGPSQDFPKGKKKRTGIMMSPHEAYLISVSVDPLRSRIEDS